MRSRVLLIVFGFAFVFSVVLLGFRARVLAVSRNWAKVGGGISWDEHPILGPTRISLGCMPGIATSDDLTRVNAAFREINDLPLCHAVTIDCKSIGSIQDRLQSLFQGTTFSDVCLWHYAGGIDFLSFLISECKCQNLVLVSTSVSYGQIESLKIQNPNVEIILLDKFLRPIHGTIESPGEKTSGQSDSP